MPWGPIIALGIRLFGNWMLNRSDPNRIRFFELRKLRKAQANEEQQVNAALDSGDVAAINRILAGL